MIYGYKNTDGTIEYLGASDTQERLLKALQMAGIDTMDIQFTNNEPVNINGVYYIDTSSDEYKVAELAKAKAAKIAELKDKRDTEEVTLIEYNGNTYDYDSKARERMRIAREALQDSGVEGASIVWTTADNQRVTLTVADFADINGVAAYRSDALHIKYNQLKEAVNACTTVEEVQAIEWGE